MWIFKSSTIVSKISQLKKEPKKSSKVEFSICLCLEPNFQPQFSFIVQDSAKIFMKGQGFGVHSSFSMFLLTSKTPIRRNTLSVLLTRRSFKGQRRDYFKRRQEWVTLSMSGNLTGQGTLDTSFLTLIFSWCWSGSFGYWYARDGFMKR